MKAEDKFITLLLDDIAHNRLDLPTLPEVAMKVRQMVDDPSVSAPKLAKLIGSDAALSARLLQVANSVFFRGLSPVENVQTAIVRLGSVCVRNVVSSLVMRQLYQAQHHKEIKEDLQEMWLHGTRVAAIANVLARHFTDLNPDEAMLAGLIHDIGILPILSRAVDFPEMLEDREALNRVIADMHPSIGKLILEEWHFPETLVQVAAEHEQLFTTASNEPTYVDIVIIADLHSYMGQRQHPKKEINWSDIPAFEKLKLTPEGSIAALTEAHAEIAAIQKILAT